MGTYEGPIIMNKEEVIDCSYQSLDLVTTSLKENPELYTEWFRIAVPMVKEWLLANQLTG
jgi:isopentenyl-diphosphate delta-isomerase